MQVVKEIFFTRKCFFLHWRRCFCRVRIIAVYVLYVCHDVIPHWWRYTQTKKIIHFGSKMLYEGLQVSMGVELILMNSIMTAFPGCVDDFLKVSAEGVMENLHPDGLRWLLSCILFCAHVQLRDIGLYLHSLRVS